MSSSASEPERPYVGLVRHVIDDGQRTRRVALLVLVTAFAAALIVAIIAAALMLISTTVMATLGGCTAMVSAGAYLARRSRRRSLPANVRSDQSIVDD